MPHTSNLEQVVDDILSYMTLATARRVDDGAPSWHHVPLSFFNPATAIGFGSAALPADGWFMFDPDQDLVTPDVAWPINVSALVLSDCSGQKLSVSRVRSVPAAEARGRARFLSPRMLEISSALIAYDGSFFSARAYAAWLGSTWLSNDAEAARMARAASSLQLTDDSWWKVTLAYEGYPGVAFHTDPSGAREAFRLRDLPNGKSRRAALRHWVSSHWRRREPDGPKDIEVVQHLRGVTRFSWRGMSCEIRPSQDALQLAAAVKGRTVSPKEAKGVT